MYKENKDSKKKFEFISLGETKFMGLIYSPLSNKMRHIDIRLVNLDELPYTWFYYSSGQIFNILIRKKLKQKGYKLNEYGLFKNNNKVNFNVNPEDNFKNMNQINQLNTLTQVKLHNYNEKYLLKYIETIERAIFKVANMEYQNVVERY